MKRNKIHLIVILGYVISIGFIQAQDKPAYMWKFDHIEKAEKLTPQGREWWQKPELKRTYYVTESISGEKSQVLGNYFKLVPGISGTALLLDGITSFVKSEDIPSFSTSSDFSVGAWMALAAYPTNWCPVADNNISSGKGFSLGVDAYGYAGFKIFIGDSLYQLQSDKILPLRKWTYLEGTYSEKEGIRLYVNDELFASKKADGKFNNNSSYLLIGKSSKKQRPIGTIRPHATEPVYSFFDGIIDELRIFNYSRTRNEIAQYVERVKPENEPPLVQRSLPSVPSSKGSFGAVYTTLKYHDAYDALWKVGNYADVVVRFPGMEGKFIFWRGTGYVPQWVSENNIWYTNMFLETWSERGCHEPMADTKATYSNVRIIENSSARVVVHWRYPLSDNWDNISRVDSLTGWGEWVDELYTIYPDGVAVRKATLYSPNPESSYEWQESTVLLGPGQRPEDVLDTTALTFANTNGETYSYSWGNMSVLKSKLGENQFVKFPSNATIQLTNTKAKLKPFVILDPKFNASPPWKNTGFRIYIDLRSKVSIFPWWNHWPTAQNPSDGRYALHSDVAAHSSLTHPIYGSSEKDDKSVTKIMLNGLTYKSADQLASLAKSWTNPAVLRTAKNNYLYEGYDSSERAYKLTCVENGNPCMLIAELDANSDTPLENLCIVIKNWGKSNPLVKIDDKLLDNTEYRFGHRLSLEGIDLILWVEKKASQPVKLIVNPEKNTL